MLVCIHTYQFKEIEMEQTEKTEFGELLTRLIREKKMTQSYFYEKVGIAKPYFYDILAEKTSPSLEVQYKMLSILQPRKEDQILFFDLIAKAKNDIPADVYKYILNNKDMINFIYYQATKKRATTLLLGSCS